MDELEEDETVAAVRGRGPLPLPLEGWDQASVWGWDETTGRLYARLRRNADDQAPAIEIGPDDYTPAITWPETLAQHVAMTAECRPWRVLTALFDAAGMSNGGDSPAANEGGIVVTVTEGYRLPDWPYRQLPW